MPNVRLFWLESVWPPSPCEAETTKEQIKTKTESWKLFLYPVDTKFRLIVMSTNLENREREREKVKVR